MIREVAVKCFERTWNKQSKGYENEFLSKGRVVAYQTLTIHKKTGPEGRIKAVVIHSDGSFHLYDLDCLQAVQF